MSFPRREPPQAPRSGRRPALLTLLALAGLSLGGGCRFHRVDPAPLTLDGGASAALGSAPSADGPAPEAWWLALESEPLDALIRQALTHNHNVAASRERLNQALAVQRRTRADFFPQIDADAGIEREFYARGRTRRGTERRASAGMDWDVDLFGRTAYASQARAADTWTRLHEAEDFRLRLSVDVAQTYLGLVEQRRLITLLGEQLGTANELRRIIEQRYEEGLISNLDVLQQQSQVAELESELPVAQSTLENLQNRLGALIGSLPSEGSPATLLDEATRLPEIGALAPLAHADELLRRRPDLRAAQAALIAADAETGRALAERLPALTLSADALHVSSQGPAVTSATVGAEIVQPLLDWGARRAEWVRAGAVYRERLATYSQRYLDAAWEVQALVQNERRQRELLETLARRRLLLETTIQQARSRYDAGLTDYLPVLSATQQFYSVEQRLLRERRRLASLRVSLHQALGGPVPADEKLPPAPRPYGGKLYSLFND